MLLHAGKLINRSSVAPLVTGASPSATMYLLDKISNVKMLVDSGAEVSLFPASAADRTRNSAGPPLIAANGSPIKSFGYKTIPLSFQNRRYEWKFILADVPAGILGADFLRAKGLQVNLANRTLVSPTDLAIIKGFAGKLYQPRISVVDNSACRFRQLLKDRPNLTTPDFNVKKPPHNVELHIPTTGPPVFARPRRLPPEKLATAKKEFQTMEQLGIIRRSDSPWASPLHMVMKKNGSFRPCGDYRRLNNVTSPDLYPIPYLSDASHFLSGKTVFSKIDLIRGYHQIPVAEADIPKTAVITPFGLWEFVRTPFGLKNAAQAFQRLMDRVGGDLDFIFIYMDDILVASADKNEHYAHLQKLFDRLEQHGLVINPEKCLFAVNQLEFLGHQISAAGSIPLRAKVDAVAQFPEPTTVQQMQQFVGLINFYNRFIPKINLIMAPLFQATAGKKKNDSIQWSTEVADAFQAAKDALSAAVLLKHPHPAAPTSLTTDASDLGIGAVLEQKIDGMWQPLAFFSKKFRPAETKYSAFDRELLAVHLSIRHFRYFLEGRQFSVFTDHKPLTSALSKIGDPISARQSRHLSAIAEYTTDIQHVAGKNNIVADALSRQIPPTIPQVPTDFEDLPDFRIAAASASATDLHDLAVAQAEDRDLQEFVKNHRSDKVKIGKVKLPDSEKLVICEFSRNAPRPLVPEQLRRRLTAELHELAHPGIKATVRLVKDRFFWPNQARDIKAWTATCIACQKSKIIRHVRPPTEFIPVPADRFAHIHLDIVGPLPPSHGCSYLLTIVDRFTRWPEAIPVPDISTPTLVSALMYNWISRFGVPKMITSDRGAQFTSALWSNMSETLGIQLNRTTAYHPQSNGLVERMHRRLKEALKARLTSPDWFVQLPWVLLGLRSTVKEDLDTSPAELVFGSPLALPGDVLPVEHALPVPERLHRLHLDVQAHQPAPTVHHSPRTPAPPVLLPQGTKFVFIRRDGHKQPLSASYEGPYKVLQQTDKVITVQRGLLTDKVSANRCKAALVDENQPPAQPPRRGRPPAPPTSPRTPTTPPPIVSTRRQGRTTRPPRHLADFDLNR